MTSPKGLKDLKKWIQGVLAIGLVFFVTPAVVSAENSIEDIHLEIELHEDGSATIHETRQMETEEDTELYIELENLQDTELLNFQVDGFTEEEDWDIDASFEEKAGQYGVIDTDDSYELAWGITEYGTPEYNLSYTLSNLVRGLDDGQALFWNFDSFLSLPTDRLRLEVSAPFPLDDELLGYYGFGFEGPLEINEGNLEWTGYGLDEDNDVTVLMQFPTDTFQTDAAVDMTLAEQEEMATAGSSYNDEGPMPVWAIVLISVMALLGFGSATAGITVAVRTNKKRKENNHFYPHKMIQANRGKTSDQPPVLDGDVGRYSALISKVVLTGGGFSEYFFSYLMHWAIENRIAIQTTEKKRRFLGPKTEAQLTIKDFTEELAINQLTFSEYMDLFEMGESTLEEVFWAMLIEISEAGEVDGDAVQKWSQDNTEDIAELVELMEDVSEDWLEKEGYLKRFTMKDWKIPIQVKQLTSKGDTFVTNVIQYYNFIKNIEEASLSDYEQWHELMVWAALFGQAEDTVETLEEFHPNMWNNLLHTYPTIYGHYYGYHYFYTSNTAGLKSGGYNGSGAGGFSSGGGGAGAGGGGGGGSR